MEGASDDACSSSKSRSKADTEISENGEFLQISTAGVGKRSGTGKRLSANVYLTGFGDLMKQKQVFWKQ